MSKEQKDENSDDKRTQTNQSANKKDLKVTLSSKEKSFLLVVKVPEPQVDEDMLRERLSDPKDRMERWRKTSKPTISDVPKIQLPDNKKLLSELAEKLEAETGDTPVLLKTASTFVMDLTDAELVEIQTWSEIQEIIPNYKIGR